MKIARPLVCILLFLALSLALSPQAYSAFSVVVEGQAHPGQTVTISGTTTPDNWLSVRVVDEAGSIVFFEAVRADAQGSYSIGFVVPSFPPGQLLVLVGSGSETLQSTLTVLDHPIVALNAEPAAGGTPTGGGTYPYGTELILRANPNTGYSFAGWYQGEVLISSLEEYSFTVRGDLSLLALFLRDTVITVTVSPPGSGSVSGAGTYGEGQQVTLTATPAQGYRFTGWWYLEGTQIGAGKEYTFTAESDLALEARFEPIPKPPNTGTNIHWLGWAGVFLIVSGLLVLLLRLKKTRMR